MKYTICGGTDEALEGHCPHCNTHLYVSINANNYPQGTDLTAVTNIPWECHYCGRKFVAINNGMLDNKDNLRKADAIFEAWRSRFNQKSPRSNASADTYSCTHCGAERKSGFRYCPQCRLDGAGRPADAGANFYG